MKTAQILLGYYKQGRDLGNHLEENPDNVVNALNGHADQLAEVVTHLDNIIEHLKSCDNLAQVTITADDHFIQIAGPDALIDTLIEKDLAELEPFEDMDDEGEFDDDDILDVGDLGELIAMHKTDTEE